MQLTTRDRFYVHTQCSLPFFFFSIHVGTPTHTARNVFFLVQLQGGKSDKIDKLAMLPIIFWTTAIKQFQEHEIKSPVK